MKFFVYFSVLIFSVAMSACAPDFSEITDIDVDKDSQELDVQLGIIEPIPLPNCDGTLSLHQTLRSTVGVRRAVNISTDVRGTGGIEASIPATAKVVLEAEITRSYNTEYNVEISRADEVEMGAAPSSHVEYDIQWEERNYSSLVSFKTNYRRQNRKFEAPFTFTIFRPLVHDSRQVPCVTQTDEAIADPARGTPMPVEGEPLPPTSAMTPAPLPSSLAVTRTNPIDGAVYVKVPSGRYPLRSRNNEGVIISEFWMKQTEVTNAEYKKCFADGACKNAPGDFNQAYYDGLGNYPVTDISFEDAQNYAEWTGGHLPSRQEWEIACAGDEARKWPWGSEPEPNSDRLNISGELMAVGSFPEGASPFGILDMAGNVAEITNETRITSEGEYVVIRGGAFNTEESSSVYLTCSNHEGVWVPGAANRVVGFRVTLGTAAFTPSTPTPRYTPIVQDTHPSTDVAGALWEHPTDGALYIFIPAGEFVMGATKELVSTNDFWIKQTEVTNAQYAQCVEAGPCTEPNNERWNDPGYADHPVTHVQRTQARDYAEWVGGRLPTETEWEIACRGRTDRSEDTVWFPWGKTIPDADSNHANFVNIVGDTLPVGAYSPQGDSPYGVMDLAGNVSEITASQFPEDDANWAGFGIQRGGDFRHGYVYMYCYFRQAYDPNVRGYDGTGFRVIVDP